MQTMCPGPAVGFDQVRALELLAVFEGKGIVGMALTYELFKIYQWFRWFSESGISTSDMKWVMDTLIFSHGLFTLEVFLCLEVKPG